MKNTVKKKTLWMAECAVFMAIVIVVQLVGSVVHIGPASISLVLIPIVVGGMVLGPAGGAVLGLTFGVMTIIGGLTGADMFTAFLFQTGAYGAIMTVLICVVKATAAGFVSALIYKLLKDKNHFVSVILASMAAPIINTGLFLIGALLISDSISGYMQSAQIGGISVFYFLVVIVAGLNFIVEFIVNTVLSPAMHYLVKAVSKGKLA